MFSHQQLLIMRFPLYGCPIILQCTEAPFNSWGTVLKFLHMLTEECYLNFHPFILWCKCWDRGVSRGTCQENIKQRGFWPIGIWGYGHMCCYCGGEVLTVYHAIKVTIGSSSGTVLLDSDHCDHPACPQAVQRSLVPPAWQITSEPPLCISLSQIFVANRHLCPHGPEPGEW